MSEGYYHLLLLDYIVQVNVVQQLGYLGAPRIGEFIAYFGYLAADYAQKLVLVCKYGFKVFHQSAQVLMLVHELLALKAGKPLQAHVKYCLGLPFREVEALNQAFLGRCSIWRRLYKLHDLIDIVKGDDEPVYDMQPLSRLFKVKMRTPGYYGLLELQVMIQHLPKIKHLWLAVDERQHDHAKGVLHRRVLIELVEHHVGVYVALKLDHYPHSFAVGFVAQVADALDLFVVHKLGYALDKPRLVHLIWYFGYDNARVAGLVLLDLRPGAYDYPAASGPVGLLYAAGTHYNAACGEIRAADIRHKLLNGYLGIVYHGAEGVDGFAHVMRRYIGRHAYGDSAGPVYKQVGKAAGQRQWLGFRFVEVGSEINGVLFDVPKHFGGDLGHARLGITHGGRSVAVYGAEVAVPLHKHVAHGKRLGQPHKRVVYGGVAVRVVFAQHVAHYARAFSERLVGLKAKLVHRVQYAPVDGLEAVAHIGERAVDYYGHGVRNEGFFHLVHYVYGQYP